MTRLAGVAAILCALTCIAQDRSPLTRTYREGEKLTYRMKASNQDMRYEAQASGVVKKDTDGGYFEEFAWSNLTINGSAVTLPPASVSLRQRLTLAPERQYPLPDLSKVYPMLIGPITDLMNYYVDLWLAIKVGGLSHAGDHVYHKMGTPASWADGTRVVLGEDSIDFDMTLTAVSQTDKSATLLVRHVPPKEPQIKLPADWMREPVSDTRNNWVEVTKQDGKYIAAIGKETFDVEIRVSLTDGKILHGTIENPVSTQQRECTDATLKNCSVPQTIKILRRIELTLER